MRSSPRAALLRIPPVQALPQHVQFCFRDRAFKAQGEAVGVVSGVVYAVGVGDQRAGHGAQVQQPVPVCVRPRQPGNLDRQDDADVAEAHFGGQASKTSTVDSP